MLTRLLISSVAVTVAGLAGASPAGAEPDPPPAPTLPIPNVFEYTPMNPADYTANKGRWYAFAGPPGVVCVLDSLNGRYGCSGPLPGAPGGANLVSAGPTGLPSFSTTPTPEFADAGEVRMLPPNTRLTYRQVTCGVNDSGVVACLNGGEQVGFVVGPTGTYIGSNRPPPPPPALEAIPAGEVPPPPPMPPA